jgi:tetratricopeptide (TPR) repeat protein
LTTVANYSILDATVSVLPFDSPEPPLDEPSAAVASGAPLNGETVVFTGKLWALDRKEARAVVQRLGGACEDEVTQRTTLVIVGGETYPDGVPDLARMTNDHGTHGYKLRRAAQINAENPGQIRLIGEDEFCRIAGLPSLAERRAQHYGQRDVLAMYPALRADHLRYLQKWGFIRPAFKNHLDTFLGFSDLTLLRQVHAELQKGAPFRAILRDLQANRTGQLTFDFRIDAHPARIIALKPREALTPTRSAGDRNHAPLPSRPLTEAEQYFLMGSMLDDGTPERHEEAARAYRRALDHDPDLVAALINLANIRYARDELAEAQALYERAILLDPEYFEAHFNLGNIHHDHGRYIDAEACYREALGLNASYADAHFYLAVTLEKMGRSSEAQPHWRSYQRLAPDGEWVELAREFSD